MGKNHVQGIMFILLGLVSFSAMSQSEPDFSLAGFATIGSGTTGGANGSIDTVTTGTQLQEAINKHKNNNSPLILVVEGLITRDNSEGLSKIDVKDVVNISIIGSAKGAEFDGIGIKFRRVSNVIFRNITIHHVHSGEKDCIGIEGPADHIWIDHCELYNEYGDVDGDGDLDTDDKDYYDGLLDVKADAQYLTYSWNYLHGSWKTSLVGSSESDTVDRKLTIHHNYYENCYSRLPLFRGKTGHIFNCYYHNIVSTAINSRLGSCIRVEKNYFENVHNPWVSAYSDIPGGVELRENQLVNSPFDYSSDDTFEPLDCEADIPYIYDAILTPLAEVKNQVISYAGVGKLADATQFTTVDTGGTGIAKKDYTAWVQVFPNPITNSSVISFHLKQHAKVHALLFNAMGEQVFNMACQHFSAGIHKIAIPLNSLPKGFYVLYFQADKQHDKQKIIVL